MTAPIVLSLGDVAAADILKLVTSGALRPGRITPRGAIVYEPTAAGLAALSAWADDPNLEHWVGRGKECAEGDCESEQNHQAECELHQETKAKLEALRERVTVLCNELTNARISVKARAALLALQESDE